MRERIVELCNCEGAPVETGEVLARLDDREAAAMLDELKARLPLRRRERDRLAALAGRNVARPGELERAESEVAQLEAMIAGQTARLGAMCCARRATASCCARTARSARSPSRAACSPGSASRIRCSSWPRSTRRTSRASRSASARSCAPMPSPAASLEAEVASITPKGDPVAKTYRVRLPCRRTRRC